MSLETVKGQKRSRGENETMSKTLRDAGGRKSPAGIQNPVSGLSETPISSVLLAVWLPEPLPLHSSEAISYCISAM